MTTFPRALIEVTIAAPAEEVWRSLRDKERIAQWFGWQYEGLEDGIDFIFIQRAKADDAAHTIQFGRGDRIELEANDDNTCVLRIVRPAPSAEHDWDDIFEDETQGWIAFLTQLRFAVEQHPNDKRRTLFLAGSPRAANQPLAAEALGLPHSEISYGITAPTGDRLAGKVWHRGKHQVALTVDGIGLLVSMNRPADAKYPLGHSQVIFSTYGLSDQAYDDLAARWRAWWGQHFDDAQPGR
ncbi:MAG: hypothetical protein QM831_31950 [Kofleriaceae bacterium]